MFFFSQISRKRWGHYLCRLILLWVCIQGLSGCGGSGDGPNNNDGINAVDPNPGFPELMVGAIPPPVVVPKVVPIKFKTEDGTSVDIEAIEGKIIVQFNLSISESNAETIIANNGGAIISKIPAIRYYVVTVSPGDEMAFIEVLRQEQNVSLVVPDIPLNTQDLIPNEWDKFADLPMTKERFSWHLKEINAPLAWELVDTSRLQPVEIGIIESSYLGLEDGLKDFDGRLRGIPTFELLESPDDSVHGTAVTVFSAATGNNNFGNVGVNWWSKIRLVSSTKLLSSYLYHMVKAVEEGSDVINLSFGLSGNNDTVCETWESAIKYLDDKAIIASLKSINTLNKPFKIKFLVVKASGNDNCEHPTDPSSKPDNLMIVGASDNNHGKAYFSNYGSFIDIAAPGYPLWWMDYSKNDPIPQPINGTSFSAPLVTGVAALVWAMNPGLSPADLIQRLKETSRGNISVFGGAGILDFYRALGGTESVGDTIPPSDPMGLMATAVISGQIDLSWTASTDDVGVVGYNIYRDGIFLQSVNAISTSDAGLSPSTQYCYSVSAYDSAGNESGQSIQACATTPTSTDTIPPSVPTGLGANAVSSSQINLSWTASTDDVGVAGYNIYREGIFLKSVNPISASDTGLSPSTQYCYAVSAYDAGGNESGQSAQTCATTISPEQTKYWANAYGGLDKDEAFAIQETMDGGFIVAGVTESFGAGSADVWILRLDSNGSIVWQKTYGGTGADWANSIQQTTDGGFIVAGQTGSFGAGSNDAWILKLDSNGSIVWQKTYGGTDRDWANSIKQAADGGFIVAGWTESFGAGSLDMWVVKLRSDGAVDWQKVYGGTGQDAARSVLQTTDGGFIVAGSTYSFGTGRIDMWVLRLDSDGTIVWQKTYGGTSDWATSIQETTDGGYIVAGASESFGAGSVDVLVVKLSSDGTVVWQKAYGGTGWDGANAVLQTTDGGYIVAGQTASFGAGSGDAWVIKLDSNGTIAWERTYGGTDNEMVYSIQQTSDSGYIMAGGTVSFSTGFYDFWVLRLDSNGAITGCTAGGISSAIQSSTLLIEGNTTVSGEDINATMINAAVFMGNADASIAQVCYYSRPRFIEP